MALAIGTKKIWDYWASKYDRIWGFQKYSLRPTRRFILRYIKNLKPQPNNILDIGCGVGELSLEISSQYPNSKIMAVDYSQGMISRAKADFSAPNITHLLGSLENIPPNTRFDLIVSTHSFPYFPDKLKAALQMKQLLTPGGRLLIIQGNKNNLYDYLWLALVQVGVSKADFLAVKKIKSILQNVGFTVESVIPVDRAFFIPSIYLVEGINSGDNIL